MVPGAVAVGPVVPLPQCHIGLVVPLLGRWSHCHSGGGSERSAATEVMRPTAPWPRQWARGPLATVMGANGPVAVVMGPMFPLPW